MIIINFDSESISSNVLSTILLRLRLLVKVVCIMQMKIISALKGIVWPILECCDFWGYA